MSTSKVSGERVSSLLSKQLDQSNGRVLQAWFQLKPDSPSLSSNGVASTARSVLERVEDQLGRGAESVKVLPNLNSFIVSAHPDFIRAVSRQPEIQSAKPTDVPNFGLIEPAKSVPVKLLTHAPRKHKIRIRKGSR